MFFEKWFPVDMLKLPSHVQDVGMPLFVGDNDAIRIGATVQRGGVDEDVTGTVKGYVILPNGADIAPFDGYKEGNRAWIDLPGDALCLSGRIQIALRVFDGEAVTTLAATTATVRRADGDTHYDPEDVVGDLTTLISRAEQATTAAEQAVEQTSNILRYDAQTLSATQQAQARGNIGAADAEITDQMIQPVVYWDNDGTVSSSGQSLTRTAGDHFTLTSGTVTSSVFFRVGKTLGATTAQSTASNWVNQLAFSEGVLYTLTLKPIGGTVEGSGSVRVVIEGKTVQAAQAVASVPLAGGTVNFVWPDATKGGKIVLFTVTDAVAADYEFLLTLTIRTVLDDGVAVSGATPTITAVPGIRYECGTVTELSFTPASSGLCEVVFASGSTATVLTLPSTVRMPDWWTGVEANRTYDIMILNGTLAGVMSWAT